MIVPDTGPRCGVGREPWPTAWVVKDPAGVMLDDLEAVGSAASAVYNFRWDSLSPEEQAAWGGRVLGTAVRNTLISAGIGGADTRAAGFIVAPVAKTGWAMVANTTVGRGMSQLWRYANMPLGGLAKAAFGFGRSGAGAATSASDKLYHYTLGRNATSIAESGLAPGRTGQVFTTTAGDLTPLQAQIELALPPNRGLPGALFEIDAAGLQSAGIRPAVGPVRVLPTSNAPGGGVEVIFMEPIPPEYLRRIR